MIYGVDRTAPVTLLTPSTLANDNGLGKWVTFVSFAKIQQRFPWVCSELSADNSKKFRSEPPSFCKYNCSVSHLRRLGVHFKLSDRITLDESHLRVPLDSSPSNTSLKREGRYISTFSARTLRRCRAAFGCPQILTSLPTGYSY
jgi:hypothetical protein